MNGQIFCWPLLVVLIMLGTVCRSAISQTDEGGEQRILWRLVSAGIALDSRDQLMAAVRGPDPQLAASAAFALRKIPNSDASEHELLELLSRRNSPEAVDANSWDLAAVYAAESLRVLKSGDWVPKAAERLQRIDSVATRIQMGSILALSGDFRAWPLIKASMTSRVYAYRALLAVPSFAAMSSFAGKSVDIQVELLELMNQIPEEQRTFAGRTLGQVRELAKKAKLEKSSQ